MRSDPKKHRSISGARLCCYVCGLKIRTDDTWETLIPYRAYNRRALTYLLTRRVCETCDAVPDNTFHWEQQGWHRNAHITRPKP